MKALLAIIVSLVSASLSFGQDANKPIVKLGPEDVIRRIIASGGYEGHDAKIIGPMGDAASVIVTKVVAEQKLGTGQIDSILLILNVSFADPRGVEVVSDRQPRTALFVLRSLESSAKDPELKKRIAKTMTYVQEQYNKYVQSTQELKKK